MKPKKNPNVDVNRLRTVLLEVGLIAALLVVIAAFLYTPREVTVEKIDMNYGPVEEQITEITRQDQKPPEPPKKTQITVITDILNIVTNDTQIDTSVDFAEFDADVEIVQSVAVDDENIEEDQPFLKVEEMPSFQGGDIQTFRNWVMGKIRYPSIAQENHISGRVIVQFVIERDGVLTNIRVLQTPDQSLSDEAVRVLKLSPKWKPGRQRNQTVRVMYNLPVDFRIQE